ncbi:hypothetical protein JG688_00006528, partial [Phytophthora aleatoria]
VVGVLALQLLLKDGQSLNEEQLETVTVDSAVSLVYWMQKGTERHQENAVKLSHDGVMEPAILMAFTCSYKRFGQTRDRDFVGLCQQIFDVNINTVP